MAAARAHRTLDEGLVTRAVGSMWCAYAFALFGLIGLPGAIRGGPSTIVSGVAHVQGHLAA